MSLWCKCGGNKFWPQNGPRYRSCHLRGHKSLGPLEKSRFCAKGPFRILEMAPFSDFQGLTSLCPTTFTALKTSLEKNYSKSSLYTLYTPL